MKIFSLDSPLMRVLGKMADLLILNLLTLMMCVPVITAGAAFTAMHYCCLKLARDHETSMWKQFFHSFKENFRQSTIIWVIFLVIMAVLGFDFMLMYENPSKLSPLVLGGVLAFLIILLFGGCMVFPIQAKFANPISITLKTAFSFSFRHFFRTLLMLAAKLLPLVLMLWGNIGIMIFPMIVCFCFTAPGYLSARLYNKYFLEAEEIIYAREAAEKGTSEEDDERIFIDVPEQQPSKN